MRLRTTALLRLTDRMLRMLIAVRAMPLDEFRKLHTTAEKRTIYKALGQSPDKQSAEATIALVV